MVLLAFGTLNWWQAWLEWHILPPHQAQTPPHTVVEPDQLSTTGPQQPGPPSFQLPVLSSVWFSLG